MRSSSRSRAGSTCSVTTSRYDLDAADRALDDLSADRVNGAAVLLA